MINRSEEYQEGYRAYLNDEGRDSNPYSYYDDESLNQPANDWDEGYMEAAWDD